MPSFDIVSEIDMHETTNAVDQANREVGNRFDFKGTDSRYALEDTRITLYSQSDFQLRQMLDILQTKLSKRGLDLACLTIEDPEISGKTSRQRITLRQGIDQDIARGIIRLIKDSKLKVQVAIQGDKLRITGKKRDDLQAVIALLRTNPFDLPLQYVNFRD